jgi:transcriptional regulator with PAS, ATPase and Fis domain
MRSEKELNGIRIATAALRMAELRRGVRWATPRQSHIVGSSTAMQGLIAAVDRCARTGSRVVIVGESGTGKELIATEIHRRSPRAERPFVPVNCAGLAETLLESELFGHVKGSFTGAFRDRAGKFEMANSGTLFLDEIGEMTLRMQGLLLRVLETGEIHKVGSDHVSTRVDVRVIAATNRDLKAQVERGAFREDLYYRLNVMQLHVPPLRERRSDIRELADHFLARYSEGGPVRRLAPEVYTALEAYSWPGNIRQLENTIQGLLVSSAHEVVTAVDLPAEIQQGLPPTVIVPRVERRHTTADRLYAQMRNGRGIFWEVVHAPYMAREIARHDVREVVRLALIDARGQYSQVAKAFNITATEYRKFLSFLRAHGCLVEYRDEP